MPKTVIQTQFDHFVSQQLWPLFKARGYRRTGNNFRFYDSSGWGKIINPQKSQYGDRDHISFTLNTGLYLPEAERLLLGSHQVTNEKFGEPRCIIRKRLDALGGTQQWYDLHQDADSALLLHVHDQVVRYVLPYLDRITNRDTILQHLLQQRGPLPTCAQNAFYLWLPAASAGVGRTRISDHYLPVATRVYASLTARTRIPHLT
jgi:hypothetical protein